MKAYIGISKEMYCLRAGTHYTVRMFGNDLIFQYELEEKET